MNTTEVVANVVISMFCGYESMVSQASVADIHDAKDVIASTDSSNLIIW